MSAAFEGSHCQAPDSVPRIPSPSHLPSPLPSSRIVPRIVPLISLVWFWFGRGQLKGVGEAPEGASGLGRVVAVFLGAAAAVPVVYYLLAIGAEKLQVVLTVMFVLLAVMLVVEGIKNGAVARDKVIAMLIIFAFNILFWMFFEQAGSSFTFLADQIVNRDLGFMTFPTAWFQSVNSVAIIVLALSLIHI